MIEIEDSNYCPKTEIELEQWMKKNCFNFHGYSINGNAIFEGFGIDKFRGDCIWYYTERGEKRNLKHFQTEKEIVEYAYNQIKADRWAKAHCIGFTTNKYESIELANILHEQEIEFFQDEIPYYGLAKPAFRTYVLGCDINKVLHLKGKYYKPPRK